jgi:opacity protein-like surface antigen
MRNGFVVGLVAAASLVAVPAFAQDTYDPETETVMERYGVTVAVGGGVVGFVDEQMRDTSGTGGIWDVRVGFGTNWLLSYETAYTGGIQPIDALGLDTDAQLLSTTVEGLAVIHPIVDIIEYAQPYVFVGAAWKRYDLTNVDVNTSSVEDTDDQFEVPFGLGVRFRPVAGMLLDVRGTYRWATDEDMVPVPNTSAEAENMDSWTAAARIGYEF